MTKTNFKKKTEKELKENLIILYKQKLKLLLEKTNRTEFKKRHILKNVKKDLARTLTFLNKKREHI